MPSWLRSFLASSVEEGTLARFRAAYCFALIPITLGQLGFAHAQYRRPPTTYIPIQMFRAMGIGLLPEWVAWCLAVTLVVTLACAALGRRARSMLLLSVPLAVLFFGATTGWRWKYVGSPDYAFEHALHPAVLLLLACAPGIERGRIRLLPRPRLEDAEASVPGWPLSAIEIALGLSYFGAFYCKISDSGLAWADGYNLQTYLLEKYSFDPTLRAGLWLAQHRGLCQALSIGTLVLEGLFVTVVLVPRRSHLRRFYVAAGVSFHAMTWWTMGISVFALSYCAVYLVFLDAFWPSRTVTGRPRVTARVSTFGVVTILATLLVFLSCIVGRINRWPLTDWNAFSTRSDWRGQADITHCEVRIPPNTTAGCFGISAVLAKRVAVPVAPGEPWDAAVRKYLEALPKRAPPKGTQMTLWVREYVMEEGWLKPHFEQLKLEF